MADKTKWVGDALKGAYEFHTNGATRKGKRPGFSKAGSVTAKHAAAMKGRPPTHGMDQKGKPRGRKPIRWGVRCGR